VAFNAAASVAAGSKAIVADLKTGRMVHYLVKYFPSIPIIVVTDSDRLARQLSIFRGVLAFHTPVRLDYERKLATFLRHMGIAEVDDYITLLYSDEAGMSEMRIVTV
jgi:pyruvate kinase